MTDLHFKFSGLSYVSRLFIQSSTNKSRQNRFVTKITGESVFNNLIDLHVFSKQAEIFGHVPFHYHRKEIVSGGGGGGGHDKENFYGEAFFSKVTTAISRKVGGTCPPAPRFLRHCI